MVGGHDDFVFEELKVATQAVLRGAELIGATRDATFPMPDGPWPGTGAVLAAVETAVGRKATTIVGKPEPTMYEAARDRLGEGRILGVGRPARDRRRSAPAARASTRRSSSPAERPAPRPKQPTHARPTSPIRSAPSSSAKPKAT